MRRASEILVDFWCTKFSLYWPFWISYLGVWIWSTVDSGINSVLKTEQKSRDGWWKERQIAESLGKTQWKEHLPRASQEVTSPDCEDFRGFEIFLLHNKTKLKSEAWIRIFFWRGVFNSSRTVSVCDSFKKVKFWILQNFFLNFFQKNSENWNSTHTHPKYIIYRLVFYIVYFKLMRIFTGDRKQCHQCQKPAGVLRVTLRKKEKAQQAKWTLVLCNLEKDLLALRNILVPQTWSCPG